MTSSYPAAEGFGGAIRADVAGARQRNGIGGIPSKEDQRRIADEAAGASKRAEFPCPICGAPFHLKADVERHRKALGDLANPGFKLGDQVVNTGDRRLTGKVNEITHDHAWMFVETSLGELKKSRVMAVEGPRKGQFFWRRADD